MTEDALALGLDPSSIPEHWQQSKEEEKDVEIWQEHQAVVELFLRGLRQWRVIGEAFLGLDYGAIQLIASLMNIELTLSLLDDLQIMEAKAVEILNNRRKKS